MAALSAPSVRAASANRTPAVNSPASSTTRAEEIKAAVSSRADSDHARIAAGKLRGSLDVAQRAVARRVE